MSLHIDHIRCFAASSDVCQVSEVFRREWARARRTAVSCFRIYPRYLESAQDGIASVTEVMTRAALRPLRYPRDLSLLFHVTILTKLERIALRPPHESSRPKPPRIIRWKASCTDNASPMPSTSPGAPTAFAQILPGAPTQSLQAVSTFVFRYKRYVAYISGKQLNLLSSPASLVQAITFREELVAVTAESQTGKLVVATRSDACVLEPVTEGWTRIWWEKALVMRSEDGGDEARCLSWGSEGEVLAGGSRRLSLYSTLPSSRTSTPAASPVTGETVEERKALWSKPVTSPVQYACFSPTSSLIATCGTYDRLVKIWRRLSFEEGLFDYTYVPHLGAVTHLEWRPLDEHPDERRGSGISRRHEEEPEVLYTIANDGVLRVWRTGGLHDTNILLLHTTVDLVGAIPQSPTLVANGVSYTAKPARYAFVLPADKFCAAVTAAPGRRADGKVSHSLEHLKEVATKEPDIAVTLDGQGRMSAWGLQSIGHKRRPETPGSNQAFHVAHAEGLSMRFPRDCNARLQAWFEDANFHILAHSFDGNVHWWQGDVETFFSPSAPGPERLASAAGWSGHCTSITGLRATEDGIGLFSRSEDGDCVRWERYSDTQLRRSSISDSAWPLIKEPTFDLQVETGVVDPSVRATNNEIAALASTNRKDLVIIALQGGYVEHRQFFEKRMRHLQCFSFSPSHNFLAVGFDDEVAVLAQGRYEHHHELPVWAVVKTLSIAGLGIPITGSQWLRDGSLALAVGNGIMLSDNCVATHELDVELQQTIDCYPSQSSGIRMPHLAQRLKAPLPVWHPSLLSHLAHHGNIAAASSLLRKLLDKLKFWSEGEHLPPLLDTPVEDLVGGADDERESELNDGMVRDLMEQLQEKNLPAVSDAEQRRLISVLEALAYVSEHARGLDNCALRYLFNWKLQLLYMAGAESQPNGAQLNGLFHAEKPLIPRMQWREIAFAYHSTTQQPLLDIITLHYDNKMSWDIARSLGITAWLADKEALDQVFDSLAQSAYRHSSPPDPINASLYFLALHKKPTLLGLWRIATWHKEQRATTNFLKRDFSKPDAKTAAKKNAYALMGKRRFEYAAAFFLLADDAASATSILAGQCGDVMLAIAVGRLYSGDGSTALRKLLEDRLMPQAEKEGNRWLMSWCHAMLSQRHEAAHALVRPLGGVRTWQQDDPATVMLYRDLRKSSSEHEHNAVLRAARVLRRMGLWVIALEVVSKWHFQPPAPPQKHEEVEHDAVTNGISHELPSMLNGFMEASPTKESPPVLDAVASPAPAMDDKAAREARAAELLKNLKAKKDDQQHVPREEKPLPTQFKEPDSNSLLDSFGF